VGVSETKKEYVPAAVIAILENIDVKGAMARKTKNAAIAVNVHKDRPKWGVVMDYQTPYVNHAPNVRTVNLDRLIALMTPILNAKIVPVVRAEKSLFSMHVSKTKGLLNPTGDEGITKA